MEEFKAQLGKMDQGIKGLGPFRMVEETINGFQQSLPLIQNLKSDSLRERHWLKLMELTGKTFDMNPRTFTLGSLFELNLDQYEDDIMTICGGALKELNIEVGINAIADTWRLQKFEVVKYSKGVGAAAQASSCTAAPQLVLCWKSRLPHAEEAFLRRLAHFFVLEEQSRDVVARCSADLDPQRAAAGAAEAAGGDGDSDSDSDFEGGGFESLFHNEEEETVRLMLGRLREEHRVTEASKQSQ